MATHQQRREIEKFIAAATGGGKSPKPEGAGRHAGGQGGAAPEPIAIVGLSGYFPSCMSHREFWRAIDEDRSLIEELPASRFVLEQSDDPSGADPTQRPSRWGGFIPDIESFDPEFFRMLPGEAELTDPQLRLLLMSVYHTLEDAGYAPRSLRKSRTGVFVGYEWNEYQQRLKAQGLTAPGFLGADSIIANQLSYYFDLRGPSEVVNTMCSGAAVATHRAVRALRAGEIRQAVVGAVNLILSPDTHLSLSRMGQLSLEPTVRSFGKDAAGYLRGEAVASILLKTLSQAREDGDSVYALIVGSAVNFNGQGGTSISSPAVESHASLIKECYREAGIDVRHVTYLEAQGMGSQLTDIVEWEACNRALKTLAGEQGVTLPAGGCHVSTLKPMTGHMHAASAFGALFKIIRSLQTDKVHKILGLTEVNPHLDLEEQPCHLAAETVAWPATDHPRLAGLHSYGATGNNAHLLIQEYRGEPLPPEREKAAHVIPFSARKPAQLRQLVSAVVAELAEHPAHSPASVALTMQTGRDEMNYRAAFVVDSVASFIDAATLWLGQDGPAGVFYGAGLRPSADAGGESAGAVAARWVSGEGVVWPRPDNQRTLQRLRLPGYPFETVRCWYEAAPLPAQSSGTTADTSQADTPTRAPEAAPQRDDHPRFARAESIVRHLLGDFLKLAPQSLDLDRQFSELGFNSLLVIHLSAQLHKQHGINLLPASLFAQTSPRGLIRLVADTLGEAPHAARESHAAAEPDSNAPAFGPAEGTAKVETPARQEAGGARGADSYEPIAIIGVAGSYPDAPDLTQFWQNLSRGVHSVRELPAGRWPARQYHEKDLELAIKSGKYYAHRGGFLDQLDHFDALFFNLSPAEAEYMHVKERLFMQCAWHALEDAGYTPAALKDEIVGVFVGVSKAGLDSYKDSYFSLTNRVSYRFNFTGPSMPVDTACSSSLSALHEACLHIHAGDCTAAVVGGVNAYTHPSAFTEFSRLRVMSPDGTTRAFGAGANGFVPGEGVGAVFLKRLSRAVADGDNIYAVIRGTAVNHGGKTNGYTVPNPQAHQRLIQRALRKAGVSPRAVSYVEAHGTGTPLGDPVEIQGLTDAFRQGTPDVGYCRLGSVKTNIGHLEAGAGVAGLTKILLQMKYGRLVPSLHSEAPNPHIDFSATPFQVQHRAEEWQPAGPDGQPISRVACISSFGAGGSNAHAVVEEFVDSRAAEEKPDEAQPALIVLSARSEAALKTYARRLAQAVEADDRLDLRALAYTLQVGREPMPYRLAFVAVSLAEIPVALDGFARDENSVDVFFGHADGDSPLPFGDEPDFVTLLNTWFVDGRLSKVAKAWVRGFDIDWSAGYRVRRPRRVSLPGYPFETEQFPFAPITVSAAEAAGSPRPQAIHPLLHQNISDVTRQCFSSTFSGDESFFTDHVVHGRRMMPGAAFLELARAAVEHSLPQSRSVGNYVRLKNVVWAEPLVASGPPVTVETEVSIDDGGGLRFEIFSDAGGGEDRRTVHARGSAELVAVPERHPIDLQDVARRFSVETLGAEECYRAFAGMGIVYGPAHRGIHRLLIGDEAEGRRRVLTEIVLPDAAAPPVSQLLLHPSILDSAFQSVLGFAYGAPEARAAIPFALDAIDVYQRLPRRAWAITRQLGQISGREAMHRLSVDLYDESGTLCLSVEGLTSRVPTASATEPSDRPLLFVPRWRKTSTGEADGRTAFGAHLVFFCGVEEVSVEGAECRSVNLRGLPGDRAYETCLAAVFEVVREQMRRATAGRRVLVQVVVPDRGELDLLGGAAAFLKTAHLENPALSGQLIKVAAGDSAQKIARQLAEAARHPDRQIVRYENGEPYVVEWRQRAWNVGADAMPWRRQGVYLITGGAGRLGRLMALEIARQGADARLMLVGRTANNERITSLLEELRALGAQAEYSAADVTNIDDVIRVVRNTLERFGALDGIIHCAGLTLDNYLPRKTADDLLHVLAPKVKGTFNLDAATKELPLEFFVMFSSAAAAIGHPAQADYAAANAFMDEFAAYRGRKVAEGRRRGLTLSINWALWQDGGMSLSAEQRQHLYRASGMEPIKAAEGLAAFYQCMASGEPQVLVIAGDHARLIPHITASSRAGRDGDISERLLGVLRAEVARIIAVDEAEIDPHVKLEEYGLDAVQFAELIQRINKEFSLRLPPTALTEQETLAGFSSSLAAGLEQPPTARPEQENPTRREEVTAAPAGDALASRVTEFLRELLSKEIKLPVARVKPNAPFEQYGINSLMIVQMTAELEKTFGTLPKTLFFEYTTLASLATYFVDNYSHELPDLLPAEQPEPPAANKTEPLVPTASEKIRLPVSGPRLARRKEIEHESLVDAPSPDDIAIIGVAGRYPQAADLRQLWLNLRGGRDCVTEVPASRWDHARFFDPSRPSPGKTYARWGGFLDAVDAFDPLFFNISPREAEVMEPQERLFLECAYEAVQDAGYRPADLGRSRVGVFAGVMYEEYQLHAAQMLERGRPVVVSSSPASIPNRVSFFCGFTGPSVAVDTMCSSSLTAIHLACRSIISGECEAAVAGGVNVSIHPAKYLMLGQGGFASTSGRCMSFGEGGDGYVPGEGVGALVLKRLSQAEADGDHVYAVVRATSVNHGGRANGFTVPGVGAQAEVVAEALRRARVRPETVSYVEAHGTGTALGDPVEIAGLARAFGGGGRGQYCAVGSIKSNIGHCESAAGVAGVTKVLLQMRHGELAPSLHSRELNPRIDFAATPFYVQRELGEWRRPREGSGGREWPRRAGVSSFGAGGSNAHVVLEEYGGAGRDGAGRDGAGRDGGGGGEVLVLVSGRRGWQAREGARRLLARVEGGEYGEGDLGRIAYTSQVGREAMGARLAVVAASLEQLRLKLSAFLAGDGDENDHFYFGSVSPDAEDISSSSTADAGTVGRLLKERRLEELAALWVQGVEVDWSLLYGDERPRRISLPTYPFEDRRFWLPKYKGSEQEADAHPTTIAAGRNGDADIEGVEVPRKEEITIAAAEASAVGKRISLLSPAEAARLSHQTQSQAPLRAKLKLDALSPSPATETNAATESKGLRSDNGQAAGKDRVKVAASVSGRNGESGRMSERELRDWLRQSLTAVLYLEDDDVDGQSKFLDLGLDSVVGVEWTKEINQRFHTSLSADTVHKYPDLNSLSRYLLALLGGDVEQGPASAAPQEPSAAPPAEARRSPSPAAEQDAARLYPVLRDTLAGALYMEPEEISVDRSFMDYGLDSVVAVEWTRQLKKTLGAEPAASDIYEHPTIRRLAAHLAASLTPAEPSAKSGGSEALDDLIAGVQSHRLSPEDAVTLLGEIFVPSGNGSE